MKQGSVASKPRAFKLANTVVASRNWTGGAEGSTEISHHGGRGLACERSLESLLVAIKREPAGTLKCIGAHGEQQF